MTGGVDRAADTIRALVTSGELYTGIGVAALLVVLAAVLSVLRARRTSVVGRLDPGLLLAAATTAGLAAEGLLRDTPPLRLAPVAVVVTSAGAWAMWSTRGQVPRPTVTLGPLLAVSVAGVYFTVPETSGALVLLGAAVPVALAGLLAGAVRPRLTPVGALLGWGVVVWVGVAGGQYRASAVVGAFGCAGVFALEPLARHVRGGASPARLGPVGMLAAHLALVYGASRVAGIETSGGRAVVVLAAIWSLAVVALALLAGTSSRGPNATPATRSGAPA